MKKTFSLLLLAALGLMSALTTSAQPTPYSVTVITSGKAYAINKKGDIGGSFANYLDGGFVYSKGQFTTFPQFSNPSRGYDPMFVVAVFAINDSDAAAGWTTTITYEGGSPPEDSFVSYQKGKVIDIAPGSTDGGFTSWATAINNAGTVVGAYEGAPYVAHAYRYQNGQFLDLGSLGSGFAEAFGINNAGQIVGIAGYSYDYWEAFLYSNGKMQPVGGTDAPRFFATAINDNNWIAGSLFQLPIEFTTVGGQPGVGGNGTYNPSSAALCINNRVTSLGTLPGFTSSSAVAINNNGMIVGNLNSFAVYPPTIDIASAFIYVGGKMYDLNTLVQGFHITQVGDINDSGQIAATAVKLPVDPNIPIYQLQTYAVRLDPAKPSKLP